jgi:hypothetical protein
MTERWPEPEKDLEHEADTQHHSGGSNGILGAERKPHSDLSDPVEESVSAEGEPTSEPVEEAPVPESPIEEEFPAGEPEEEDLEPRLAATGPELPPVDERIESRLRRLEDSLAQLQDLRGMEQRVVERVADHIQNTPSQPAAAASGTSLLKGVGQLLEAGAHIQGEKPAPDATGSEKSTSSGVVGFLWEIFVELRSMIYMFVDPRYSMSWWGRGFALVLLVLLMFSFWLVPGTSIPFAGYWINKVADLVLAYLLFKVLLREARRYRQFAPELPKHLRM